MSLSPLAALEALLFAANEPPTVAELSELMELPADRTKALLDRLQAKLAADNDSGITLERVMGGYRLVTKREAGECTAWRDHQREPSCSFW